MKYEMTLLGASMAMNKMMSAFDMRMEGKWFYFPLKATIDTKTQITEEYFMKIINDSKEAGQEWWIPAIQFQSQLFVHESVKILSDGIKEMFVNVGERQPPPLQPE